MKFVEVIKVFGYILVLMLCFALMKGLSTFEYNLREDKSVSYEQGWAEDFSQALDKDRWKLSGGNIKLDNGELVLSLNKLDSPQVAMVDFPTIADSGYVSLSAILPAESSQIEAIIAIRSTNGADIPLDETHIEAQYYELRSQMLAGKDLATIVMTLSANAKMDSIPLDYRPQKLVIKSLQYMKMVRPQKLF